MRAEISISPHDKDGWVEVTDSLPQGPLDLLLHSPGGSPFMAEWVVSFLRAKFSPIRVIVPHTAKSAAAMIALSGDELVMDERGELGPIDPQLIFVRDDQTVSSPAQAILDQFERARKEIEESPGSLPAWLPVLRQYGPSLLEESQNAIDFAKELVTKWLETYMFSGEADASTRAAALAGWLGDHNNFKAHPRQVLVDDLLARGAKVVDMRRERALRDAVWAVWCAYLITFDQTGAFKVFENSRGHAFIRNVLVRTVAFEQAPPPLAAPQARPGRAERRRQQKQASRRSGS
jgi:hypothetical protein